VQLSVSFFDVLSASGIARINLDTRALTRSSPDRSAELLT
jgi:hypothetical protein